LIWIPFSLYILNNFRICFAHGGGSFAFLLGRLENAWKHRELGFFFNSFDPIQFIQFIDFIWSTPNSINSLISIGKARGRSIHPPSHYLNRFYVDSAVFDDGSLQLLKDVMGDDHIMLGSQLFNTFSLSLSLFFWKN